MYEYLVLVFAGAVALNTYYDGKLFRSVYDKHRKYFHVLVILLVGLAVFYSLTLQPLKWQLMVEKADPYMPEDMRRAIHPVLDFTNRHFAQQVREASLVRDAPLQGLAARGKVMRNVTERTKKLVAASQQWVCAICRTTLPPTYEVDHIVRLEYGGSNDISNLQALCPNCHRYKTMTEKEG